jgi:beta-lactamase class A
LQEDYEEGTGDIQYESIGSKYSIAELSRLSIVSSDNVASNMLKRLLGMSNVRQYMSELGGSVVDEGKNISCPKDMGIYMKEVYNFYMEDKVLGNELMHSLLNTEFNDRIPALLPKGVKVAHKIGTQVEVVNDVGIIFAENPYILSVMSKDVNEDEAPEVLANISKKVYNYVNQKQ